MALKREQCVIAVHPMAIIGDADETSSARFHVDADTGGTSVERILEQLLNYRRGTVNHLAGGDLIGHLVWKNSDAPHKGLGYRKARFAVRPL